MLALGRGLMTRPRLMLLDEPSLGLAPLIVRDIFRIIASLRQSGMSILLVEQNARAALETADYAYVLETGEIRLEGPASALMKDERVNESYLGSSAAEVVVTDGTLTFRGTTSTDAKNPGAWSIAGISTPGTYSISFISEGFGIEVM